MSINNKLLCSTKQKKFKGNVFGFDIETSNKNRDFLCASIYLDDNNKWTFKDKEECINFFKNSIFKNAIIVATNLSFDFFGTFYNSKFIFGFNTLFRGSDLLFAQTYLVNGEFSNKYYGHHPDKIIFIDTMNYCKMSVDEMGKILKVLKLPKPKNLGEYPKNEIEWEYLIKYNMRDAEVSKKFAVFLINGFEELGATFQKTIASTAMSIFKNKYLEDNIYFRHPIEVLDDEFKAYYGGRTEVFERGLITNKHYYDFNSLYPTVMQNKFPNPNYLRTNQKNTLLYIKNYEGVSYVHIFCPPMEYPFLPFKLDEEFDKENKKIESKLIFPCGFFSGWYSHIELRKAMELGYKIIKVLKTHYYIELCEPFKNYVKDLYSLRLMHQKEKNPMEIIDKLLMNSLYGKFGQKFRNRDNWVPMNMTIEELEKYTTFEVYGDYALVKKDFVEPSSFCIPIWALYVTAYARIKLYDKILELKPCYVDTDSLITDYISSTSSALGDLKEEMFIIKGLIVKPKMYALYGINVDKFYNIEKYYTIIPFTNYEIPFVYKNPFIKDYTKIKGIPLKFNISDFTEIINNPTFEKRKFTFDKFMRFKESIRRGFIPNEIIEMTKELSLEDTKRQWQLKFNPEIYEKSEPLVIYALHDKELQESILKERGKLNYEID